MCPTLVTLKSSSAPNACWRWILQLDFEALCRTLKSWAAPQISMLQSIMLLMLLVISDCNSAFLYVLTIYNIWLDPLNMIRILHFMKPGDLNDITVSRILHFLQCAGIIRKLDITAAHEANNGRGAWVTSALALSCSILWSCNSPAFEVLVVVGTRDKSQ
jgi:hypothetical protein